MKLEGSLDVFSLRELIEITVYSSVTGVLNIFASDGVGQLYFRDGQPYHACYGDATGERAVALLFEQRSASFAFVADVTNDNETLWHDPIDLIDAGERLAARWMQVRMQIDATWLVPKLISDPETARFQISPEHWMVLSAIDGERRLDEIAEDLGLELLEVCEAVLQMQSNGLLALHKPDPNGPRSQKAHKARNSLLGRVLADLPPSTTKPLEQSRTPPREPSTTSAEIERILRLLRGQ